MTCERVEAQRSPIKVDEKEKAEREKPTHLDVDARAQPLSSLGVVDRGEEGEREVGRKVERPIGERLEDDPEALARDEERQVADHCGRVTELRQLAQSQRERREGERERRLTELAERLERSDTQLLLGRLCEGDDAAQDRDGDDLAAVAERRAGEADERPDEAQRLSLLGVVLGVAREGAVRGKRGRVMACALDETSREGGTHRTRKSGRWCSLSRMASDASTRRWRTRRYVAARTSLPAESARDGMILRARPSASTRCEERGVSDARDARRQVLLERDLELEKRELLDDLDDLVHELHALVRVASIAEPPQGDDKTLERKLGLRWRFGCCKGVRNRQRHVAS